MHPSTVPAKRDLSHVEDAPYDDHREPRRTRKTSSLPFPTSFPTAHPVVTTNERRRVNPEALATRLGPEVVAALDALIPAGSSEMPSFQARKSVQERYKIDRRHIYDYFHAKGLRVERCVGASASKTPTRPTADDLTMVGRESVSPTDKYRAQDDLPTRPNFPRGMSYSELDRRVAHSFPDLHQMFPPMQARSRELSQTQLGSLPQPNISTDIHRALPSSMSFSSSATDSLPGPLRSSHEDPFSAIERSSTRSSIPALTPDVSACSDHDTPSLDFGDILPALHPSPAFVGPSPTPILPVDELDLSQKEREENYHFFSYALGPATGFQESIGSYKSFMETQTHEYFRPLSEASAGNGRASSPISVHPAHVPTPASDCVLFDGRRQRDTRGEDFKKWLMAPRVSTWRRPRESTFGDDLLNTRGVEGKRSSVVDLIEARWANAPSASSDDEDESQDPLPLSDIPAAVFGHVQSRSLSHSVFPPERVALQPAVDIHGSDSSATPAARIMDGDGRPMMAQPRLHVYDTQAIHMPVPRELRPPVEHLLRGTFPPPLPPPPPTAVDKTRTLPPLTPLLQQYISPVGPGIPPYLEERHQGMHPQPHHGPPTAAVPLLHPVPMDLFHHAPPDALFMHGGPMSMHLSHGTFEPGVLEPTLFEHLASHHQGQMPFSVIPKMEWMNHDQDAAFFPGDAAYIAG